jgi:hypothetical protein
MADKFYTKPEAVETLLEACRPFLALPAADEYTCIVEPSAGSGNISRALNRRTSIPVLAYDIAPEHCDVVPLDFLHGQRIAQLESPLHKTLVIGNPPFGYSGRMAVEFFNRAASYASVRAIAFIVPRSFRKAVQQNRLAREFWLHADMDLPSNSFTHNGTDRCVDCCVQIWTRHAQNHVRGKQPKYVCNGMYRFVLLNKSTSPLSSTIVLTRTGRAAGRARLRERVSLEDALSRSTYRFLQSDRVPLTYLEAELNKITWTRNNSCQLTITHSEFFRVLNQITEKYSSSSSKSSSSSSSSVPINHEQPPDSMLF